MKNLQAAAMIALASLVLCILACIAAYMAFGRDLICWTCPPPGPGDAAMPPSSIPSSGDTRTRTPAMPPPSIANSGGTWTRPTDGAVMVYIPAGKLLMGSSDEDIDALLAQCSNCEREAYAKEQPQHTVFLDAFWIDRTEVTNAQYGECMEAGACYEPECWEDDDLNAPDQPVVCLRWADAQDYAAWVGGRLPTEAEWEKAARGPDGRIYPWGNSPPGCNRTNSAECTAKPLPVGSHPDGASPYGVLDMGGNVQEWVADWYDAGYYSQSPLRNPQGPESGAFRAVRGGSFCYLRTHAHCAVRVGNYPINRTDCIGFRVVVAYGGQ